MPIYDGTDVVDNRYPQVLEIPFVFCLEVYATNILKGAQDDGRGNLYIHRTLDEHQGDYECTAQDPQEPSRAPEVSEPARISLNRPAPPPPEHPPKIHGDPPRPGNLCLSHKSQ